MSYDIAELFRRFENLIRLGTIEQADQVKALVRVRSGDLLTDWLPVMQGRAGKLRSWSALDIGEQVILLCISGDPAQGIVLRGLYQDAFPAPSSNPDLSTFHFDDGAVIEYDQSAQHLKFALPTGATMEVISDGGLSITGDVDIDGNITATGDITDQKQSMQDDRDIYNGHTHGGSVPQPVARQ